MAVESQQVKIDPYTSTVPLVQLPVEQAEAASRPAQPLQGQFGKAGTGALAIGDSIFKGFLKGQEIKEKRKYAQATATISAADKSTEDAYQQYQDTLSSSKDPAAADAAYKNYTDIFNRAKQAKAQFAIPEKPAKGTGQKKSLKDDIKSFGGGIKDFMEANPHIVPQIALLTMQPKPPGQSREAKRADLQDQAAQGQIDLQKAELTGETQRQNTAKEQETRAAQQRAVEASGGIDAVLNDKKSDPLLQQTAREMKYTNLDKQSPEGKMKMDFLNQVQSGTSASWTPQQRMLAGLLGAAPPLQETEITGKNGHKQQVLIDPMTNQPVPGSKPLDLGPPPWAQEFYAKRGAEHADIRRAVEADPVSFGITPSSDPKAMKAAIDARVDRLVVEHEFGIHTLAGSLGKTGYEIQRDNSYLEDASKELNSRFGAKNPTASFDWAGGQRIDLTKEQANQILNQFVTDPTETSQNGVAGIRAFRDQPNIQQGKDSGAAERDRQWAYGFVKGRMMARKGKDALTSAQADDLLKNTALGRPIASSAGSGPMSAPPEKKGMFSRAVSGVENFFGGGITPPPAAPGQMKMYMVPGYDQPVQMTDDEAAKARANNIPVESVDALSQ